MVDERFWVPYRGQERGGKSLEVEGVLAITHLHMSIIKIWQDDLEKGCFSKEGERRWI